MMAAIDPPGAVVDRLVGALDSVAALIGAHPDKETAVIGAVTNRLTGTTMALLETLLIEAQKEDG